jgi:uncharacterized protein DUF4383
MVHVPVNHPLQPLYRLIAGLIGAYILAFGITGVVRTHGFAFFAQEGLPSALGLHANRAFAILSIVVGVILLGGALIGGNLDQRINLVASVVFIVAGLLMLTLLRTNVNFLGFTPATCIVSFLIGVALLIAGLYGKVGTLMDVRLEEDFRHGRGADPSPHPVSSPNPPYERVDPVHRRFQERHRDHQQAG